MEEFKNWLDRVASIKDSVEMLIPDVPDNLSFAESTEIIVDLQTVIARLNKILEEH